MSSKGPKKLIIGLGTVAVLVVIVVVWLIAGSDQTPELQSVPDQTPPGLQSGPDDSDPQASVVDPQPTPAPESTTPDQPPANTATGLYLDWPGADGFDQYRQKRRWLSFHADWCPQCISLEKDIRANLDQIPADVVIFKVDYDNNPDLRDLYGVNIQTTVVAVDGAGDKLKSQVLYSEPTLATLIDSLSD